MLKNTKRLLTAASITVAAAAIAVTGTAASMASPHLSSPTTLRLRVHGGTLTLVNVRHAKAIGIGDEAILSQPVYAAAHPTQVIGHAYITSTFLTRSFVSGNEVTLALKHGDIDLGGTGAGARFTLAVVGGTGSYRNARGQATVKTGTGKSNPASITLTLLP